MHKKITTPIDIQIPVQGVIDHGLDAKPRNWLHEVSIADDCKEGEAYLRFAWYRVSHGWKRRDDGKQMWVWTKEYHLTVANW